MAGEPLHIPIRRLGRVYRSLDTYDVIDARNGQSCASVSQANSGLIQRDLRRVAESRKLLKGYSSADLIAICAKAGELFMSADLPVDCDARVHTPHQYVQMLSATSGLPHVLCRSNMQKINEVFTHMGTIMRSLMRGLDLSILDQAVGTQSGITMNYIAVADALGVVLPSNSPGVNSIWLPAIALKLPVVIKPGHDEPWTPLRMIEALIGAGYPQEALGFYPTDHSGTDAIINTCDRSILFGDDATIKRFAGNPHVQLHGTGRSKIILGDDVADDWEQYLDVLLASILNNGGRSCINASCIITAHCAGALADSLARRLAQVTPRAPEDEQAQLSAFSNPRLAEFIDRTIDEGLAAGGATDVTLKYRRTSRLVRYQNLTYLHPTIIHCEHFDHPLANTEFMFPFASVIEMSAEQAVQSIGPTLAATVITHDTVLGERFLQCGDIDRLNLAPVPTTRIQWDQPHEGNLFELLYRRRAIQTTMKQAAP